MKGVGAKVVSLLHSFGCGAAGENDDWQGAKFWVGTNVFEHFKAAGVWHDNIKNDKVRPANGVLAAHADQAFQIGNSPLRGFGNVPLKRDARFFARGLEKDLIVSAVIDVEHEQIGLERRCG